jgi:hypothetical protein
VRNVGKSSDANLLFGAIIPSPIGEKGCINHAAPSFDDARCGASLSSAAYWFAVQPKAISPCNALPYPAFGVVFENLAYEIFDICNQDSVEPFSKLWFHVGRRISYVVYGGSRENSNTDAAGVDYRCSRLLSLLCWACIANVKPLMPAFPHKVWLVLTRPIGPPGSKVPAY